MLIDLLVGGTMMLASPSSSTTSFAPSLLSHSRLNSSPQHKSLASVLRRAALIVIVALIVNNDLDRSGSMLAEAGCCCGCCHCCPCCSCAPCCNPPLVIKLPRTCPCCCCCKPCCCCCCGGGGGGRRRKRSSGGAAANRALFPLATPLFSASGCGCTKCSAVNCFVKPAARLRRDAARCTAPLSAVAAPCEKLPPDALMRHPKAAGMCKC